MVSENPVEWSDISISLHTCKHARMCTHTCAHTNTHMHIAGLRAAVANQVSDLWLDRAFLQRYTIAWETTGACLGLAEVVEVLGTRDYNANVIFVVFL